MLAVAGCSSGTGIPALDRGPVGTDQWPGDKSQLEGLDRQSVRFLVSHGNADYFAATSADGKAACLFKFPVGEGSAAGGSDAIVELSAPGAKMILVRADADTMGLEGEGWARIHENILVF